MRLNLRLAIQIVLKTRTSCQTDRQTDREPLSVQLKLKHTKARPPLRVKRKRILFTINQVIFPPVYFTVQSLANAFIQGDLFFDSWHLAPARRLVQGLLQVRYGHLH